MKIPVTSISGLSTKLAPSLVPLNSFSIDLSYHKLMNGYQPISVSLIKSTPALDTVVGVTFFK